MCMCVSYIFLIKSFSYSLLLQKLHTLNKYFVSLFKHKIFSAVCHKQVFQISQIFRMGFNVLFLSNSALLRNISSNKSSRSVVDLTYTLCRFRILEMRFEEKLFYRTHWDLYVSIIPILDFTLFWFLSLRKIKAKRCHIFKTFSFYI